MIFACNGVLISPPSWGIVFFSEHPTLKETLTTWTVSRRRCPKSGCSKTFGGRTTEGHGGAGLGEGMAIPLGDCPLIEWQEKEVVMRRPTWAHARKDDL